MANKDLDPKLIKFLKEDIRQYPAKVFDLTLVHTHGFTIKGLLTYSHYSDKQVSFRAAWLLEHICIRQPSLISEIYSPFIERLGGQQHWGTIRSYTKIAMLATHAKSSVQQTGEQEEILIEQCFNWLINPECPVAVAVNCLDILYNLRDRNPWITEELKAQIHYLLQNPTPALASRAKRILKRID